MSRRVWPNIAHALCTASAVAGLFAADADAAPDAAPEAATATEAATAADAASATAADAASAPATVTESATASASAPAPASAPDAASAPAPAPVTAAIPDLVGEVIEVHGQSAAGRQRALNEAPFVTVIDADNQRGEQQSVATALMQAPSVQLRSTGGLGGFTSVSVRGASSGHTQVLVNGVPLSRLAAVTSDLGAYSLESFAAVELYRGGLPLELAGGGLGGAVNMVTRLGRATNGDRVRLALGGGSFGAKHFHAWHGDQYGKLASSTAVALNAAAGDFTTFSDNGTPLNRNDDSQVLRRHNGFASAEVTGRIGAVDNQWSAGLRGAYKAQQLPGALTNPAMAAELATANVIADAVAMVGGGRHQVFAMAERQAYRDPANEIGVAAQDRRYTTLASGAQTSWAWARDGFTLRATGLAGVERFADRAVGADTFAHTGGSRVSGGAGVSLQMPITVTPRNVAHVELGLRLDGARTNPGMDAFAGMPTMHPVRSEWLPSPRATLRMAPAHDVAIKASAGYYGRLPTVVELFGDRGFVHGSPDLRAERGPMVEAGVVWAPVGALAGRRIDRLLVEAVAYSSFAQDKIVYVTQAGFVSRPINIGNAMIHGAELSLTARWWRKLALLGSYSWMTTEQQADEPSYEGKALPRHPAHRVYARATWTSWLGGRELQGFVDGNWFAQSYLDQGNLQVVPARTLLGMGARAALVRNVAVTLEVKNMSDNRTEYVTTALGMTPTPIVDVAGFPLPGRAFYGRLEWSY